jgi:hypothetical protein
MSPRFSPLTRHTKIYDLDGCRLPGEWQAQDFIFWLDVFVNEAGAMRCHESPRDFQRDVESSR